MSSLTPWSNLAKVVYRRTYSRPTGEGTQETYLQTITRAITGNVRGHNVPEEEVKSITKLFAERKATTGGRGLWFSGTDAHKRIGGVALNNCWYLSLDEWHNFVIAMDLLMLGGGVGGSIEHRYISKLPRIKKGVVIEHKPTNDADLIVSDSREGWCYLLERILQAFFETGKGFSYSTVCIRGRGEAINGFGGTASGPIPLIEFVTAISAMLSQRAGRFPRPVDAMDLLCSIGQVVVAGNVRRSAIIILGDPWDKEFLTSKRWDLGNIPPCRAFANLSVVCDDVEDLHPLFWKTYEKGEPFGIVNRTNIQTYGRMGEKKKDTAIGVNPCQPAFAPILTANGIRTMGDIQIGDMIWSSEGWTRVANKWSTGEKKVYSYRTSSGQFIGTSNHRVVSSGIKVEAENAESIDVLEGADFGVSSLNPQDIIDGLVLGDGMSGKKEGMTSDNVLLCIGKNDTDYFSSEVSEFIGKPKFSYVSTGYSVATTLTSAEVVKTHARSIPDRFFYSSPTTVAGFLRGLYSANGSVVNNRITLKTSSPMIRDQVQIMLSSLGIKSYFTTNKEHPVTFENGEYVCKESYDVNISTDREKFVSKIGFIQSYKNDKIRITESKPKFTTFSILSSEYLGTYEVFDITVDNPSHTYWTGGVNVSNCAEATLESFEPCNLQELYLPNIDSKEEFIEAARLMHRYGKRVTLEKYHHSQVQEVIDRNRRVGTGITGCLQSPLFTPEILNEAYAAIAKENIEYSKELGIPESIRTTLVKPSGTLSKVGDIACEGLHPAYSQYMIQRIRFASNDPLIPVLKKAGHYMEPARRFDGTLDTNTLVVDFYVANPDNIPTADGGFDTWKQLDTLLLAQKHWADQAVSVTVYYKREELPQIKEWLSKNLQYLKTISFLCHSEHGFDQAPKEAITREQYLKASSKIKPISEEEIIGGDLENNECSTGACPIK